MPETARVTEDKVWNISINGPGQLEALLLCTHSERVKSIFNTVEEGKRYAVQFEAIGFDLGEVQNVVDDPQQMLAALSRRPRQ